MRLCVGRDQGGVMLSPIGGQFYRAGSGVSFPPAPRRIPSGAVGANLCQGAWLLEGAGESGGTREGEDGCGAAAIGRLRVRTGRSIHLTRCEDTFFPPLSATEEFAR